MIVQQPGRGPRNMKYVQPPWAAIFFMTNFYRGGGRMASLPRPLDQLLNSIVSSVRKDDWTADFIHNNIYV